ncbi:TPA: hypothetical protein F8R99_14195 [Legionella pneumophila]|nr:hypothetical protein [Legionella pneumophila]
MNEFTKDELEHKFTDEVVCPWCSYEYEDSWEFHTNEGYTVETECIECQKPFQIYIDVSVNYSTNRL